MKPVDAYKEQLNITILQFQFLEEIIKRNIAAKYRYLKKISKGKMPFKYQYSDLEKNRLDN